MAAFNAGGARAPSPQTTVPSVPQYRVPGSGQPLAQQSKFWQQNPYSDPYTDFEQQTGAEAQNYLNIGQQANPFAGGWDKATATLSSAYPDMTNPKDIAAAQAYMAPLEGGMGRTLRSAQQGLESARMQRGGYGVGSGQAPGGGYAKQALDSIASQYGGNYQQAMSYLIGKAQYNLQAQQLLQSLLQTYMGTGTALSGQQLQALQSGEAGKENWQKMAGAAYGSDVNQYNQALQSNWDKTQQMHKASVDQANNYQTEEDLLRLGQHGQFNPFEEAGGAGNPMANIMSYLIMTGKIKNPATLVKTGKTPMTPLSDFSGTPFSQQPHPHYYGE